ncbi:MAG: NUDIX domain-containing protein [Ruminococcus sp.]|nr:NUDIX domain-containing protein [Ruminococcus sp.]
MFGCLAKRTDRITERSIAMERWDVYDENRIKTGRTELRGAPAKKGEYRMVVHICIFNSAGKMLIQQRQPFKSSWSGMWDVTVGGSSVTEDTSLSAAIRETSEEIGMTLKAEQLRRALTVQTENVFDDIYIVNADPDEHSLKLQPEEVAAVKWADSREIKEMIDKGEFIPYHHAFIDLLFFMKDHDGTHTAEDNTVPVSPERS